MILIRRARNYSAALLFLTSVVCSVAASGPPKEISQVREFDEEIRFIEELREITFPDVVVHRELRRAELKDYLRSTFARDLSVSEQDYFDVLRALHLIEEEPADPLEVLLDLYVGQVLAFYDPVEDVFYSIDEPPAGAPALMTAAFQRAVTIHELVHVLQDQRFGAGETLVGRMDDWDRSLAYHALIEGEATLVMLAVLLEDLGGSLDQALEDDQIVTALGEAAALDLAAEDAPPYFVESLKFPYVEGLAYAIDLYRSGGWDAIERAHQSPPGSSEQVLDGEKPGTMEPLDLPGTVLETTLGEFHWRYLLGADAADPWHADRVAVVRGEGGLNVVAATRWTSRESARQFAENYESFLRAAGREPLVHVDEKAVTVGYGADRELSGRLMERVLKSKCVDAEDDEHR